MGKVVDVDDIPEESIQRLVEHIKLLYTPDATVDPSSGGAVSGAAVANYVQAQMSNLWNQVATQAGFNMYAMPIQDDTVRGKLVDVTPYVHGGKLTCKFLNANTMYDYNNIGQFRKGCYTYSWYNNCKFDFEANTGDAILESQPSNMFARNNPHVIQLVTFFAHRPTHDGIFSYTLLTRRVGLWLTNDTKKFMLSISPLLRSSINTKEVEEYEETGIVNRERIDGSPSESEYDEVKLSMIELFY